MLKDIFFITFKDARYMLRERETLLWVFVMPIVFFFFIGTITGGMSSGVDSKSKIALRTGDNAGFLLDQMKHRLAERDYIVVEPETEDIFEKYSRRLTIPAGFTDSVLAGSPVTIQFTHETTDLSSDYDNIRVGRAVYTVLADLFATRESGAKPTAESFDRLNQMPRAIKLEVTTAGKRILPPSGYEQAIPGITVMFLLLVMLTSGAVLLVIERRQGLLRRLACTPINRLAVVLGKWGGKIVLGIIQLVFAMLAGTLFFKMDWGPDLIMVVLVLMAYGALMASLGILLGSLARTEGQAMGIGVVSANVLAALGGCWWPIEVTPGWMQKLQLFLPTGWAMDALHKLVSFTSGAQSVLPHVIGMFLLTLALIILSVRVFQFQ